MVIKSQLDRDNEKYLSKCKTNQANGAKGGRPPKNKLIEGNNIDEKSECFSEKSKKPNGFSENPPKPTKTERLFSKPLMNNDNEDDNDINNISCAKNICTCDFFDDLWKLYPRKKGKSSVSKKALREINAVGFDEMSKAIERYKQEIAENNTQEQYILLGSTFFNGRYKDYLHDVNNSDNEPDDRAQKIFRQFGVSVEEYEERVKQLRSC